MRSIKMAAALFESVKVETEHRHKPALVFQINTFFTRIEDKSIKLFSSNFSCPPVEQMCCEFANNVAKIYYLIAVEGENQDMLPQNE